MILSCNLLKPSSALQVLLRTSSNITSIEGKLMRQWSSGLMIASCRSAYGNADATRTKHLRKGMKQSNILELGGVRNLSTSLSRSSTGTPGHESDDRELREIGGVEPNVWLEDGEETEVTSHSSGSVYKVKRTAGHYYCTCPAWRNQGGGPVNARSCKHLLVLGQDYEVARLEQTNPGGPPPKGLKPSKSNSAKAKKTSSKKTAKSKKVVEADEEDESGDRDEALEEEKAPALLLANKWDLEKGPDPTGWWISEKLDGVRAFFDGEQFISRLGNPFTAPQWFIDKLPKDMTLDGELYGGRGKFAATISVVKTINSSHWKDVTFQIFDVPSKGEKPFEERYDFLQKTFGEGGTHAAEQTHVVKQEIAKSHGHVLDKLKEIESLGGEGLMLRQPNSVYEGKRSSTLLKVKTFYDAEAIVIGHEPGKGQHKGLVGALRCRMESGKLFSVGSGLNHAQRKSPPKIGDIVTYRFQEITRDGVPRFPTYVGIAIDKDTPKDAEVPEHRRP